MTSVIAADEDVRLADGTPAVVRLLIPSDRTALQLLFDSVSEEHLYTRFFSLGRSMVTRHLDHLFARGPDVTTYVTSVAGRVCGVCDVERLSDSTAEVAFLVADDMHGRGVATLLLERAACDAHGNGIAWFTADVLSINHEMLKVFTDVGLDVELMPEGSDVGVRISTEPTEGWVAKRRGRR